MRGLPAGLQGAGKARLIVPQPKKGMRSTARCEFSKQTGGRHGIPREVPCGKPADVYGGFPGEGGWAGAVCLDHARAAAGEGFKIWNRVAR